MLQPVIKDLLKQCEIEIRLDAQSKIFYGKSKLGRVSGKVLVVRRNRKYQQNEKNRIRRRLQQRLRDPENYKNASVLGIDLSSYVKELLPKESAPVALPQTAPTAFSQGVGTRTPPTTPSRSLQAAPTHPQPGDGVSSSTGTISKSTSNTPYRYKPTDEAHAVIARAVRAVGVNADWKEVVARVDKYHAVDIPLIIPDFCNSLPQNERPILASAAKKHDIKKRIQKIIRDVKQRIREELASQPQP